MADRTLETAGSGWRAYRHLQSSHCPVSALTIVPMSGSSRIKSMNQQYSSLSVGRSCTSTYASNVFRFPYPVSQSIVPFNIDSLIDSKRLRIIVDQPLTPRSAISSPLIIWGVAAAGSTSIILAMVDEVLVPIDDSDSGGGDDDRSVHGDVVK
jgi:hypothetical protein